MKNVDNEQLACVNGNGPNPNGQRFQYSYSRQILAGAPKRSHFSKSRSIGHHNEESVVASKKKVRNLQETLSGPIYHFESIFTEAKKRQQAQIPQTQDPRPSPAALST